MKSILNETAPAPEITFPCLMQSTSSENVWLMTDTTHGILVYGHEIGKQMSFPNLPTTNRQYWKPFNGTVTLSN